MARNLITALDIGTSTIQTVVAERGENGLRILGMGSARAAGVRRGMIVDLEEAQRAVRRSVEEAGRTAKITPKRVWAALGGSHISVSSSKGVVAVSRADGEISAEDVTRAVAAAETFVPKNLNREIIHIIPREFKVDNEAGIRDPLGMHGVRLEADTLIIECSAPALKALFKCAELAGLEIADYVFSPLAASEAVLTKRQKELGVLLVDIGGGTVSFMVYEEGVPAHGGVLALGGGHVTNDIAIGFRTHVDIAERIKLAHGSCLAEETSRKEIVRLADFAEEEEATYSRRELAEIIEARLGDVFELLGKELKKIGRAELLPAGVVLVGGSSLLPGLKELTKKEMKLPVEIGRPALLEGVDAQALASLAVAVGAAQWADTHSNQQGADWGSRILRKSRSSWVRWLKSLLP